MNVAIIGLGIAGLRAAQLLEGAGHTVTGFEARDRVGGRLWTFQDPSGAFLELGGEWIDADHHRTLKLIRDHGIEPIRADPWKAQMRFRGQLAHRDSLWPQVERARLELGKAELHRFLNTSGPAWESFPELDQRTIADLLDSQLSDDLTRAVLTAELRSDEGEEPSRLSLLGWLAGQKLYADRSSQDASAYKCPIGMGGLCDQLARSLTCPMNLNEHLIRVSQRPGAVELGFSSGRRECFDRVVLTLPPPALASIEWDPQLPDDLDQAIRCRPMARISKLALVYGKSWWSEGGWDGFLMTDDPIQQVWPATVGESPALMLYVCGDDATHWEQSVAPLDEAVASIEKLFPGSADWFERGFFKHWHADPLSGGGFSYFPPHYLVSHRDRANQPWGRVHFAGEHTASWSGFIEGAVESAERVAGEIL